MDSYTKLKKNVSAIFIGNFSTKLLSFVFVRFYTSVLTTAQYGISDLIATTVSLLYPVFSVMINEAMMRMLLEQNGNEKEYFTISVKINLVGICAFLICSPVTFLIPTLAPYYVLFVLYYISFVLHNFMIYFARGVDRVNTTAIAGVISTVSIIVFNILFLLAFKMGIVGYLLSSIIGTTISSIYIIVVVKPLQFWKNTKYHEQVSIIKEMLLYSIPLIPNTISWWISNSSDRYFVTGICGAAENGIYSVAYKIPTILTTVYSIFITAWRISAVDGFGSKESVSFFSSVYKKIGSLLFIAAAGLLLFNKMFASLLYAKGFFSAYMYAPILVMSALYSGLSEFFGTVYTSNKSTVPLFLTSLLGAVLNIVLNSILIPLGFKYGFNALGAAVATLLSYIIIYLIRSINTQHILPIKHHYIKETTSHLLLLTMMVFAVFYSHYYIVIAILFCIIFAINLKDIKEVAKKIIFHT